MPKYSVFQLAGYVKGNSAIHITRVYGECKRNLGGSALLGVRVFVSTVVEARR